MPASKSERWKKLKTDWYKMLVALILSFFIWALYDMSMGYDTYIQYDVEVKTSLPGYDDRAMANERLVLQGKGDGYYVLRQRLTPNKFDLLRIEADPSLFTPAEDRQDCFVLHTDDVQMEIAKALGGKFEPTYCDTKQLTFDFAPKSFKTVPVEFNGNISCKGQYMLTSDISLTPDSVRIYGLSEDLQLTDAIRTRYVSLSGVDRSGSGSVELEPVRGIRIEKKRVNYSYAASRYVEQTAVVDVGVTNAPRGRELMVLPGRVTVVYRTAFSSADASFVPQVAVDYNDYAQSRSGKIVPYLVNDGPEIISYTISPVPVECLMTGNE